MSVYPVVLDGLPYELGYALPFILMIYILYLMAKK